MEAAAPTGLLGSVALKPYQKQSLAFMLALEVRARVGVRARARVWVRVRVGRG